MIDKAQTADILRAAANKIREVGWTQGAGLRNGHRCALSAIGSVAERMEHNATWKAERVLADWLKASGVWSGSVIKWNDASGRTMDEVVSGMEKAAAWIEEQA